MKIAWLSDLHLAARGPVAGCDPRARVRAAARHVRDRHADAAFCVVSGDLTNRGTAEDYAAAAALLAELPMQVLPMVGNHDDRRLLRARFDVPEGGMDAFVQYAVEAGEALVVCLDTLDPGSDRGAFCAERRAWLDRTLAARAGRDAIVFLHHPPMPLGLPAQDESRIAQGDALLDLLRRHPNVRHLCIGHVHRPVSGSVRGLGFTAMRSVTFQAPAPVPEWDWSTFRPAEEAPMIGIVRLSGGDVTVQFEEFAPFALGQGG